MKKSISILLMVAMAVFLLSACPYTRTPYYYDKDGMYVEITNPPEQCVLYRVLGDKTQIYKAGLFVVNYAAIKEGFYTGEEVIRELSIIEAEVLSPAATVGSVINILIIVAAKAAKAGAPEIVLITQGLSEFVWSTTPLDDCTRYKLVGYIGSQRALALAFTN